MLFSCAAAERAADGALLFDQDGMPIPLDGLFGRAEDPTHPCAKVADVADELTGPMRQVDTEASVSSVSSVSSVFEPRRTSRDGGAHGGHARPKKEPFLSRKRDGLVEVAGLAACVAAATSVLALWPSPQGDNGASNMDGSSLFLHRGASASRSAQPAPPVSAGTPPQGATSTPGASPTPTPTKGQAAPDPTAATPPVTTAPGQPAPPPADGSGPSHPTPPPSDPPPSDPPPSDPPPSDPPTTTPTPTPTPSDSPTDAGSDSPAPDPSAP